MQRAIGLSVASSDSIAEARWNLSTTSVFRVVIALMVIANLGRIPLFSTGDREAPLLLNDVMMMLVLAIGITCAIVRKSLRLDRIAMLAACFAWIGAFSACLAVPRYGLSGIELLISLAYLFRWLTYFSFYVAITNLVRSSDAIVLWRTLESTMIAFVAFGLVQAVFIPHFAQVVYPDSRVYIDFDEQGHRLVSTVLEPNMAGAMIMLVLLVQLAQLAGGSSVSSWKPLVLFAGVLATLSRSTMLGLLTGLAIILVVRGVSRRIVRGAAMLGVLLLVAAPSLLRFAATYNKLKIDGSALTRIASWLRAIRIFSDHPVLGIGFNTLAFVQERYGYLRLGNGTYSVDGGLLFVALMTGLLGLAVYVGILSIVIRRCRLVWQSRWASADERAISTGIAAGTVALCVHSLFVNSLFTSFVMEPMFVLWAIGFHLARGVHEASLATRPAASLKASHVRLVNLA